MHGIEMHILIPIRHMSPNIEELKKYESQNTNIEVMIVVKAIFPITSFIKLRIFKPAILCSITTLAPNVMHPVMIATTNVDCGG